MVLALEQPQKEKTSAELLREIYEVQIFRNDSEAEIVRGVYDYEVKIFQNNRHTCTLRFKKRVMRNLQMEEIPPSYHELAKLICFTGHLLYGQSVTEIPVYMDTERDEPLKIAKLMQKSKLSKNLRVKCYSYRPGRPQRMRWRGKFKAINEPPKIKVFPVEGEVGGNGYFLDRKYGENGYKINLEFGKSKIEAEIDNSRKFTHFSTRGDIPNHKYAAILLSYAFTGKTHIPCQIIRVDSDLEKRKLMKKLPKKLGKVRFQGYGRGRRLQQYATGYLYSLPGLPSKNETPKKFLKRVKRF